MKRWVIYALVCPALRCPHAHFRRPDNPEDTAQLPVPHWLCLESRGWCSKKTEVLYTERDIYYEVLASFAALYSSQRPRFVGISLQDQQCYGNEDYYCSRGYLPIRKQAKVLGIFSGHFPGKLLEDFSISII